MDFRLDFQYTFSFVDRNPSFNTKSPDNIQNGFENIFFIIKFSSRTSDIPSKYFAIIIIVYGNYIQFSLSFKFMYTQCDAKILKHHEKLQTLT